MIGKLVILSVLVAIVKGQGFVRGTGPCPSVTVVQNFDVASYVGKWYQIVRFPNPFELGDCSTAQYTLNANGTVAVHNAEIRNGTESTADGIAELADPNSTEAKLIVKNLSPNSVSDYWVLGTDYKNYSLVWTCREQQNSNIQFSWVLGRQKPLSAESVAAVSKLVKDNKLDSNSYEVNDLPQCKNQP